MTAAPADRREAHSFLATRTLYADDALIVIDKPWGLPVQKGTRTAADLDTLLSGLATSAADRLRLTHRLDKETTGCLLLARSRDVAAKIGGPLGARTHAPFRPPFSGK